MVLHQDQHPYMYVLHEHCTWYCREVCLSYIVSLFRMAVLPYMRPAMLVILQLSHYYLTIKLM